MFVYELLTDCSLSTARGFPRQSIPLTLRIITSIVTCKQDENEETF